MKRLYYSILFVGCEEGWSLHDSYCYRVFTNTITWENAEAACQTEGADLASVLDMETNTFVWDMVKLTGKAAWLGGNLQTGTWNWVGHGDWAYTKWKSGEPNGDGPCLELRIEADNWNDGVCSWNRQYVCEKIA